MVICDLNDLKCYQKWLVYSWLVIAAALEQFEFNHLESINTIIASILTGVFNPLKKSSLFKVKFDQYP